LPIFLGILPNDGDPEQLIVTEAHAKGIFDSVGGNTLAATSAQLLAAKLNALKLSQFTDVQFLNGATLSTGETVETFGQAIAAADQALDDLANGISRPDWESDVEAIKDLLDAANNGCPGPTPPVTPTPTAAGVVVGPTSTPSGLPETGSSPSETGSWPWAAVMVGALVALGGLALAAARRREE